MLKDIFQYHYEMNRNLVGLLRTLPMVPEKSHELLCHIVNAHQVWNSRIDGTEPTGVWELITLDQVEELNLANCRKTKLFLENRDLSEVISYTNTKGESFRNTILEILFHIVNHGTYHRGQIATDCKNHGVTPLVTDYIFQRRKPL